MKIALCIGHSRSGDSGAVSTAGTSEWDYNSYLVDIVSAKLKAANIDHRVYAFYEGGSYGSAMGWLASEIKKDGCTQAVEFHFNSAGSDAAGYEYLYWHSSSGGKALADSFLEEHKRIFPNCKNRGIKPKDSGDRGSGFLSKTHCPACILEPFFGSNNDEWELYTEEAERLADVYAAAITNLK